MDKSLPTLVILTGGASSRLWPLRDKSLLKFLDKPLLEHQLETYIQTGFREFAVICNPGNQQRIEAILAKFGESIRGRTFVQAEAKGMGDALLTLTPLLEDQNHSLPVYVCQVHDIFAPSLHQRMLQSHQENPQAAWLASYQVETYFPGGYLVVDENLTITDIIEKPPRGKEPSDLVNIVAHMHPDLGRLLDQIKAEYDTPLSSDDHYERAMARLMHEMPFQAVPYRGPWHPIKYPWHVLEAMNYYLDQIVPHTAEDAHIEEGAYISGPVHIASGARILNGADIRGPAYIGPNTLVGQFSNVRQSMVARNCIVGFGAEVNRSYLGAGAWLHAAKALDAVLAENAGASQHINLSAGMITANFRTDGGTISSTVKGKRLDTGRTKLGAMIGAGAFVSVGAMLMPGVKIGEGAVIGPQTVVQEDVFDHTLYYVQQQIVKKPLSR